MVVLSWSGSRASAIAAELGCQKQTVRRWLVSQGRRSGLWTLSPRRTVRRASKSTAAK